MVHILSKRRDSDLKVLADLFEPRLDSNTRQEIMTTGETLIEQGIEFRLEKALQKGRMAGRLEGRAGTK